MPDPAYNRHHQDPPAPSDAQKEAHKLEAYLGAFRPVLTRAEIEALERRIDGLRQNNPQP